MELPAPDTDTRETGVAGLKHVVDEKDIVLCKQNKNMERTTNRVTRIFKLRCIPHACLCDEIWWSRSPQQDLHASNYFSSFMTMMQGNGLILLNLPLDTKVFVQ